MSGNLIDTNVIVKFLNGDEHAHKLLTQIDDISIPAIVAGELFYGAYKSSRVQENLTLFSKFLVGFPIIPADESIALAYGEVKSTLYRKGVTIPDNDIWIAATAKARQCALLTFDAHFSNVDGLRVIT